MPARQTRRRRAWLIASMTACLAFTGIAWADPTGAATPPVAVLNGPRSVDLDTPVTFDDSGSSDPESKVSVIMARPGAWVFMWLF